MFHADKVSFRLVFILRYSVETVPLAKQVHANHRSAHTLVPAYTLEGQFTDAN